jgi:hypothetical protein
VKAAAVPLNATVVAPLKLAPLIVTLVPIAPLAGVKLAIVGGGITVKPVALVAVPPGVVTLIGPFVVPAGTLASILVDVTTTSAVAVPLNVTVTPTGLWVNPVPLIITICPIRPLSGVKLVIVGTTMKLPALVAVPPGVVTLIGPLAASAGTVASITLSDATVKVAAVSGCAAVPLNVTDVAPVKFVPLIVTVTPTDPLVGLKLVIVVELATTVNALALVAVPPGVVTLSGPVVAPAGTVASITLSDVTVKVMAVPLTVTAVAPVKVVPLIVTAVPTGPLAGAKLVIFGLTMKFPGLPAVPSGVVTVMFPVVAPAGTHA